MDRADLVKAITALLNKVPASISSASINQVREFKSWNQKTRKRLSKANLTEMNAIYRETMHMYQQDTKVSN